ncbi:MAG: Rrf2 family transcriptional regulator, partial [Deferribacteres bacterium]|nr:Rrf2 family transcriptional regulator [Deferribacteres bacterium]
MRAVLYLSANYGRIVPRREISDAMDVPSQFLVKIAHDLARKNIIGITQGRKGGYWLKVPPDEITVLDVFEATAGDIVLSP